MSLQNRTAVTPQAAAPPARERGLRLALLVIATAELMLVLDDTIVNVALPSMQRSLHLTTPHLNWVISFYALAFGGLLLAGGRAGDLFGRLKVFRLGIAVFTLASLAGGFASNGAALIAARVVQGSGAALAAPCALSLLATTFPAGPARTRALGVYGAMGGLGALAAIASVVTRSRLPGHATAVALTDGYVAGLLAGALIFAAGAVVAICTVNARISADEAAAH